MGLDQPWHWIVLIALVLLLFGYKKLPDASRSLGRSLRIFKTEIKGMSEDDRTREEASAPAAPVAPVAPPAPVATPPGVVAPPVQPAAAEPVQPPVAEQPPAAHSASTTSSSDQA